MQMPTQRAVFQNAWVVDDLESTARAWADTYAIGPFFVAEYGPDIIVDVQYRGAPGVLHMKTAIAYAGDMQIELVQPLGDSPCCYRDTVPSGTNRFHHMCAWSSDLDADLEFYAGRGCEAANTGRIKGGVRFAYVDTHRELGCMIELLERSEDLERVFARWSERCREWNGGEPIVRL